jgi:pimeloyl-ACP methyl ester carboxylesterase
MVMKHGFRSLPEAERALPSVRTALVPDGPVEYISAGSGSPTIVLVNGSRVQLGTWALVFPELAAISTVFAYNRLGAGGSAKPRGTADRGGDRRSVAGRAHRGRYAAAVCSGGYLDWRVVREPVRAEIPAGGGRGCPPRVEPPR